MRPMMLLRRQAVRSLCLAAFVAAALPQTAPAAEPREVENLIAFTRLYGYVRFFHPSDAAAAADWDEIARAGASQAAPAADADALAEALDEVFRPVATGLVLAKADQAGGVSPGEAKGAYDARRVVAWQHLGVGVTSAIPVYESIRTGRPDQLPTPRLDRWSLVSSTDGMAYRGREVRLRAAARTAIPAGDGDAGLLMYVYRASDQIGAYEDMSDNPVDDPLWGTYEIVVEVDDDAVEIVFGGRLDGRGAAWFDAFELEARDPGGTWTPVALFNPGFEDSTETMGGWYANDLFATLDPRDPFAGEVSARLMTRSPSQPVRLFDAVPQADDVIREEIGGELSLTLPIWLTDARPVEPGAPPAAKSAFPSDPDFPAERVAAVVVAWNVLQHFYPYFDVVDVDWDEELTVALEGVLDATDDREFVAVLERMIAALGDGHAHVTVPQGVWPRGWLPILADWAEGQVVVVTSAAGDLQPGDVILDIDGVPAAEHLAEQERQISGSPQWKRATALKTLAAGSMPGVVTVRVERNGAVHEIEADRYLMRGLTESRPDAVEEVVPGVFYVDLSRTTTADVFAVLDQLAAADGVVFDLRGYPAGSHELLLQRLGDNLMRSAWWNVSRIIYPDRRAVAGWDTSSWILEPRQPHFSGRVVFLTDARAISYAESLMGIVEHYRLGVIVGRPTAGANGNVNQITLPGGYRVSWTGMRVLKQDGSQHHIVGVEPDVRVEHTIAAIRAGRDEDLEAALALITGD